jgi:nucleoid-associated protein YgaU
MVRSPKLHTHSSSKADPSFLGMTRLHRPRVAQEDGSPGAILAHTKAHRAISSIFIMAWNAQGLAVSVHGSAIPLQRALMLA